jgi:general stress protein 26
MTEPVPSRAGLPPGYGTDSAESAPGERLPWERIEAWLTGARNYWVCTTRPDGRPHAKPVWGIWVDGALLFSTSPASVTARNIRERSPVAVHLESGDQVATFEGTPEPVRDRELLERFVRAYDAKYDWRMDVSNPNMPVFSLRAESVLAWDAGDSLAETATRWTLV